MEQPAVPVVDPLDQIVSFLREARARTMPDAVRARLKHLLEDGLAGMLLGARSELGRRLIASLPAAAGTANGTVVGSDRRVSLPDAAFANAALIQVHDCNDVRRLARRDGGSNHPGRIAVPVALTLAEHHGMSGEELLDLLLVGYEVACRVHTELGGQEYAAAIAAMYGLAEGLGPEEMRASLVYAQLSFPGYAARPDTSDFDFIKNGLIARSALSAAALGRGRFHGPEGGLGVRIGSPFATSNRPDDYAVTDVSVKPYPCCRALHGAIDLALQVRELPELAAGIGEVEVRVGNLRARVYQPAGRAASAKECQFSIPYVTACALLDGKVDEASFEPERIAAEDVQELQDRVRVSHDPRFVYHPVGPASRMRPTSLSVVTAEGRSLSRATMSPRGSRISPLSPQEREGKFRRWSGDLFSERRKGEILELIAQIESSTAAELMRLLATSGRASA